MATQSNDSDDSDKREKASPQGITAQRANEKAHQMASQLERVYAKVLALEEVALSISASDISVENINVRLPRRLDASPTPRGGPGDTDTHDPWQVKDGDMTGDPYRSLDWDVRDGG
ncbi:hypothetical protein [Nocardia sp. CA-120079]|uniref:hypothetical protein n=1 Tax=Nocardia sp. CA-120079 TaxID=3239974 RepID=UPI003D959636